MAKHVGSIRPLLEALQDAGLISDPNNVNRVVIDILDGQAVKVYVEHFGDEKIIKVLEALTSVDIEKG